MEEKNKEKIRNILSRSFISLPVCNDLPRLAKHIRIFRRNMQMFPSKSESYDSTADYLYGLLFHLSGILGDEKHNEIVSSFDTYFKRKENNGSSHLLRGLADKRLQNCLNFLPTAFVGCEDSAVFLFEIEDQHIEVSLIVNPGHVKLLAGNAKILNGINIDCKITCSSPILISILSGQMDASDAIHGGLLVVDDLSKLALFGNSFHLDRISFQRYESTVLEDNSILTTATKNLLGSVLGEENIVMKLLKCCNSATISPAIIELKFALGSNYMTKDVPNSWKFDVFLNKDKIIVKSKKQEQELKGFFVYEWELELEFDNFMECTEINLFVSKLNFTSACTQEHKETVENILAPYRRRKLNDRSLRSPSVEAIHLLAKQITSEKPKREIYVNGDEYIGEFNGDGKRHGKGVYTTPNGDVFVGEYKNGLKHGHGVYTMKDGTRYEGEFRNGKPNGKGIYVFYNGDIYIGEFQEDEFHGEGSWSSPDGSSYQGEFRNGKREGRGVWFSKDSTYDGQWKNGQYEGMGLYIFSNGDTFEGEFKNGKFNGFGRYTSAQTNETIEGEFENGKPTYKSGTSDQVEQFKNWLEESAPRFDATKKIYESKKSLFSRRVS